MFMRRSLIGLSFIIFHLFFCISCYNQGPLTSDAWNLTEQQLDSISFYTTHHYTQGYNFVVSRDSLNILEQQSEMMPVPDILTSEFTAGYETMPLLSLVDSIKLLCHERVVVADIRTVNLGTTESPTANVDGSAYTTTSWSNPDDVNYPVPTILVTYGYYK